MSYENKRLNQILLIPIAYLSLHAIYNWTGLQTLLYAGMFVPAILIASLVVSKKTISACLNVLAISGVMLSIAAVLQVLLEATNITDAGLSPVYDSTVFGFARARLFFEEPQFFGSFLVLGLAAALYVRRNTRLFGTSIILLGIGMTSSRGAALAALTVLVIYALMIFGQKNVKVAVRQLFMAGSIAAVSAVSLVSIAGYIASDRSIAPKEYGFVYIKNMIGKDVSRPSVRPVNNLQVQPVVAVRQPDLPPPSSTQSRQDAAEDAIRVAQKSPQQLLFGSGPNGVDEEFEKIYGPTISGRRYVTNNTYFEVLVNYGLVGAIMLVAWLCWMLVYSYRLYTEKKEVLYAALMAGIAGSSVHMLFFSSVVNSLHIWVFLAVTTSYLYGVKRRARPRVSAKE